MLTDLARLEDVPAFVPEHHLKRPAQAQLERPEPPHRFGPLKIESIGFMQPSLELVLP